MMTAQPPVEEIARRIVEAFHPRRIVLFGSRARGNPQDDSDVDLMVEMESPDSPPRRAMAIDALFGLRPWSMDVFVYTPDEIRQQRRYRNSLVSQIEANGRVLYERPG